MDALTGPHATPLWALMDRAPVGVFALDSGGDCAYVNERASDLAGLTAAQCLGATGSQGRCTRRTGAV
jgi:PAS domain-containing protein